MKGQLASDVWLVRHTETDWNQSGRYQSRSDRPLTREGVADLRAVAAFFRGARVAQVVSSGLARTDRLARVIADQHDRAMVIQDARWAEVDHGRWEGLTHSQVVERFGDRAIKRFRDPRRSRVHGGETLGELAERVSAAWHERPWPRGGGSVVVAHSTPIQILVCLILHIPLERYWQLRVDLGGITLVQAYEAGAVIRFMNRVPHLPEATQARSGRE